MIRILPLGMALVLFSVVCRAGIDRKAVVSRNNVVVEKADTLASLSVGNGEFAFTTDVTGLQTFYKAYENGVTLGTQSNWGWHTFPNTAGYNLSECAVYQDYRGRKVPYLSQFSGSGRDAAAANYFRENPQRLQLGVIRLLLLTSDGTEVKLADIQNPVHQLNLWEGKITSHFSVEGQPVAVELFCHQKLDMLAVRVQSSLVRTGRLKVEWLFPYAIAEGFHPGYDWKAPEKHQSTLRSTGKNSATIDRKLDNDGYQVSLQWNAGAVFSMADRHRFLLSTDQGESLEFSCLFSAKPVTGKLPTFRETAAENEVEWKKFWMTGGIVDFSQCKDPRAKELERRVVLSQYLTRIQSSGSMPPQETGLVYNSWYGKSHLEMHWWHTAHFANWNHPEYLIRQLDWYKTIFDRSAETARSQGFAGVRWPKMVGPEGQNSPSGVGSYLIWQQPHLIYMAEQLYKSHPDKRILDQYKEMVFATADFMADLAVPNQQGTYDLLPPLIPAQEHWNKMTATNPPYELAYWHWGLMTALEWKKRLHLPVDSKWMEVAQRMATPVAEQGVYLGVSNAPDSYTTPRNISDHPSVLAAFGVLPAWEKVDPVIMKNTLKVVMEKWNWPTTWGWDYPMVAMTAARVGEPETAIKALLMEVQKNTYLKNGHNYQGSRLRIYLPGNGGLLKAIALMCAGWEGSTHRNPGFPADGNWDVRWEGLVKDF
ncbi:MAG: hypothetical protein LWW85_13120 [Marinilabiliales bacterium]|nr:hypothetical protein [Marinilabiliales bacterium]